MIRTCWYLWLPAFGTPLKKDLSILPRQKGSCIFLPHHFIIIQTTQGNWEVTSNLNFWRSPLEPSPLPFEKKGLEYKRAHPPTLESPTEIEVTLHSGIRLTSAWPPTDSRLQTLTLINSDLETRSSSKIIFWSSEMDLWCYFYRIWRMSEQVTCEVPWLQGWCPCQSLWQVNAVNKWVSINRALG